LAKNFKRIEKNNCFLLYNSKQKLFKRLVLFGAQFFKYQQESMCVAGVVGMRWRQKRGGSRRGRLLKGHIKGQRFFSNLQKKNVKRKASETY
jgi:hypothetical protein